MKGNKLCPFFQKVEGEAAIIVCNGVYRQVDLYERDGYLFAESSRNGFIRLSESGSTSKAKTTLNHLSWHGDLARRFTAICADQERMVPRCLKRPNSKSCSEGPDREDPVGICRAWCGFE